MNKIYKLIWSHVRQAYVVACEYAKGKSKGCSTARLFANRSAVAGLAAVLVLGANGIALADDGPQTNVSHVEITHGDGITVTTTTVQDGEVYTEDRSGTSTSVMDAKYTFKIDIDGDYLSSLINSKMGTYTGTLEATGNGSVASGTNAVALGTNTKAQGAHSTAIGWGTTASGESSFAGGDSSVASGSQSFAWGVGAIASGGASVSIGGTTSRGVTNRATSNGSIAIGQGNLSSGTGGSVAMGDRNTSSAYATIAIGAQNTANANFAVVLGAGSQASGMASVALGYGNYAGNTADTAMGYSTSAVGGASTATGSGTYASGNSSFAGGMDSEANGKASFAFGANAIADETNSVALGGNAKAALANSVALGAGAVASETHDVSGDKYYDKYAGVADDSTDIAVVSVGGAKATVYDEDSETYKETGNVVYKQIQGVAAGVVSETSTDAVNGSQLYAVINHLDTEVGTNDTDGNVILASNTLAQNIEALDTKLGKINAGTYNYITADGTVSDNLVALDTQVKTNTTSITTLKSYFDDSGKALKAVEADTATKATQDGNGNVISDTYATKSALTETNSKVAQNTTDIAANKSAISTLQSDLADTNSKVEQNTTAISDINKTIEEGKESWAKDTTNKSVTAELNDYKLTISVTDSADNTVTSNAVDLSDFIPEEVVQTAEETAEKVVTERVVVIEEKIDSHVGTVEDGNYVMEENSIAENINILDEQVAANAENIDNLKNNVNHQLNKMDSKVERVGASAAALAGIHYQPMRPGESQIGAGVGTYRSKTAAALGVAYQLNNRVMVQISGSACNDEYMGNLGVSYKFGQHSVRADERAQQADPEVMSLEQLETIALIKSLSFQKQAQQEVIASLQADKTAQKQQLDKQDKRLAEQDQKIAKLEAMLMELSKKVK